jgi:hypothetical protein
MPASEEEEVLVQCYNCGEEYEQDDLYSNDWDIQSRCCGCNEDFVCEMEERDGPDEDNSPITVIHTSLLQSSSTTTVTSRTMRHSHTATTPTVHLCTWALSWSWRQVVSLVLIVHSS